MNVVTERAADQTCGAWRRPGWIPDTQWFRCSGCGAVVPESQYHLSDVEQKRCNECKEVTA